MLLYTIAHAQTWTVRLTDGIYQMDSVNQTIKYVATKDTVYEVTMVGKSLRSAQPIYVTRRKDDIVFTTKQAFWQVVTWIAEERQRLKVELPEKILDLQEDLDALK